MADNFYILENLNNIGELKSGGNPFIWKQKYSSLFNVFYEERASIKHDDKEFDGHIFRTGCLDNNKIFYPAPLKIGYVLIEAYSTFKVEEFLRAFRTTLIYDFDLYSKDFKSKRNFQFKFQNNIGTALDFGIILTTINYLNLYIENNHEIDEIDETKLGADDFKLISSKALLKAINNLEFDFTDYSENRVGRDNHFWTGTGIGNIPKDGYMKKMILDNIKIDDKSHYGYSPASSPRIYKDDRESSRLKKELIISTIPKFKGMEHFFERIKKT